MLFAPPSLSCALRHRFLSVFRGSLLTEPFGRNNAHRSRRKSCQACADSKIKCDQKQPCSKCQSRGRECVYRSTKATAGAKVPRRISSDTGSSLTNLTSISASDMPGSMSGIEGSFPNLLSESSSPGAGYSSFPSIATPPSGGKSTSSPSLSFTDTITSYTSTATDATAGSSRATFAQEALDVQNQLNALFSNEMFDKFFSQVLADDRQPNPYSAQEFLSPPQHIVPSQSNLSFPNGAEFPFPTSSQEEQPFMAAVNPYTMDAFANIVPGGVTTAPADEGAASASLLQPPLMIPSGIPHPLPSELEYYCKCLRPPSQHLVAHTSDEQCIFFSPSFSNKCPSSTRPRSTLQTSRPSLSLPCKLAVPYTSKALPLRISSRRRSPTIVMRSWLPS